MFCYKKIIDKLSSKRWEIGFVVNGLDGVFSENPQYVWVKNPYTDRWFADPFILDVTDEHYILLVEEYRYESPKGRIAILTIDRGSMCITKMTILLELDTHLSFPNIYRKDGKIYVYPENYRGGALNMYELRDGKLVKVEIMCEGLLTDAVMTDYFGESILFATEEPHPNDNILWIYKKTDGKFPFVKQNCISLDLKRARMAGQFFKYNNHIYRPAQDCEKVYGGAVVLEGWQYVNGQWSIQPVRRLESTHPTMRLGMHTLNEYLGHVVVDVHGYNYPVWGTLIGHLVNFKRYWK